MDKSNNSGFDENSNNQQQKQPNREQITKSMIKLIEQTIQQKKINYFLNFKFNLCCSQYQQMSQLMNKKFRLKYITENEEKVTINQNNNRFLQEGDLVFMKLYDLQNDNQYILKGNGSVLDNIQMQNYFDSDGNQQRQRNIQQCLFQIQKTIIGDKNYNQGDLICLRQKIQLVHIDSLKYLALDLNDINFNQGSFKLTLNNNKIVNQRFMISSQDKKTQLNDFVLYGDKYYLNNFDNIDLFLSIDQEMSQKGQKIKQTSKDFLDNQLFMSKIPYLVDFNCYLSNKEQLRRQNMQDKFIFENQYVYIVNTQVNGLILSQINNLESFFEDTTIYVDQNQHSLNQNSFKIKEFNHFNYQKYDENYTIKCMKSDKNILKNLSYIWQVQSVNNITGNQIENPKFYLRNVVSGLYLSISNNDQNQLTLTDNKNEEFSQFQIEFYKDFNIDTYKHKNNIPMNQRILLKTGNNTYVCSNEYVDKPNKHYKMACMKDYESASSFLFQFSQVEHENIVIANMIALVCPYLIQFYTFLRYFGMQKVSKTNNDDLMNTFQYDQVISMEKQLQEQIKIFNKAIQVISYFVKEGKINEQNLGDIKNQDNAILQIQNIKTRQHIIKDSNILLYLCYISNLIGMLTNRNQAQNELQIHKKKTQNKESGEFQQSSQAISQFDRDNKPKKDIYVLNTNKQQMIEKNPFLITQKHLSPLITDIFELIFHIIRTNTQCCEYMLTFIKEFDSLFQSQLTIHYNQIKKILEESLKNCSQNSNLGKIMTGYLGSLDYLSQTNDNVNQQILRINLVAYCLQDNKDRPLKSQQNKCQSEIFSQSGFSKSKGLIQFGIIYDRPYVTFSKPHNLETFFDENPILMNVEKIGEDQASFTIHSVSTQLQKYYIKNDYNSYEQLRTYIEYICSNLFLITNLCKGRNLKNIRKVKALGINKQHIIQCLKITDLDMNLKKHYANLFGILFINLDPYIPINEQVNRCILREQIGKHRANQNIYEFMNHIYQDSLGYLTESSKQNEIFKDISQIIINFWQNGFEEQNMSDLQVSEIKNIQAETFQKTKQKYRNLQMIHNIGGFRQSMQQAGRRLSKKYLSTSFNKVQKSETQTKILKLRMGYTNSLAKMQYLYQMLHLSYICIELGFTDNKFNNETIEFIKKIVLCISSLDNKQNGNGKTQASTNKDSQYTSFNQQQSYQSQNWIHNIFYGFFTSKLLMQDRVSQQLIIQIINQSFKILYLLQNIKTYLSILKYLEKMQKDFENHDYFDCQNFDKFIKKEMLSMYDLIQGQEDNEEQKMVRKSFYHSIYSLIVSTKQIRKDKNTSKNSKNLSFSQNSFNLYTYDYQANFQLQFLKYKKNKYQQMIIDLFSYIENQHNHFYKQISQVILIQEQDIKQYIELYGSKLGSKSGDSILNPKRLEHQVEKLIEDDLLQQNTSEKDMNMNIERINEIINFLNKIINLFQQKSKIQITIKNIQSYLRNLNIQNMVIKLFKIQYDPQKHKELFQKIIIFLQYFVLNNYKNQKLVIVHFELFIHVMKQEINVKNLMKNLIYIIYRLNIERNFRIRKKTLQNKKHDYFNQFIKCYETEENPSVQLQCLQILKYICRFDEKQVSDFKIKINDVNKIVIQFKRTKIFKLLQVKKFNELLDFIKYQDLEIQIIQQTKQNNQGESGSMIQINNKQESTDSFELNKQQLNLRLHLNAIKILNQVSQDQQIGQKLLNKIFKFEVLKSIINHESCNSYKFKKIYMNLFNDIFISQKYITLKQYIDIINKFIEPELNCFQKYPKGILDKNLCQKQQLNDFRHVISLQMGVIIDDENKIIHETQNSQKNKNKADSKISKSVCQSNTSILIDEQEYWDFLYKQSHKQQVNFLSFIQKVFLNMQQLMKQSTQVKKTQQEQKQSDNLYEQFSSENVKNEKKFINQLYHIHNQLYILLKIFTQVQQFMNQQKSKIIGCLDFELINFQNQIMIIQNSINNLPYRKLISNNFASFKTITNKMQKKKQYQTQLIAQSPIMSEICDYIIQNNLQLEIFIKKLDIDPKNYNIQINKYKLASILSQTINVYYYYKQQLNHEKDGDQMNDSKLYLDDNIEIIKFLNYFQQCIFDDNISFTSFIEQVLVCLNVRRNISSEENYKKDRYQAINREQMSQKIQQDFKLYTFTQKYKLSQKFSDNHIYTTMIENECIEFKNQHTMFSDQKKPIDKKQDKYEQKYSVYSIYQKLKQLQQDWRPQFQIYAYKLLNSMIKYFIKNKENNNLQFFFKIALYLKYMDNQILKKVDNLDLVKQQMKFLILFQENCKFKLIQKYYRNRNINLMMINKYYEFIDFYFDKYLKLVKRAGQQLTELKDRLNQQDNKSYFDEITINLFKCIQLFFKNQFMTMNKEDLSDDFIQIQYKLIIKIIQFLDKYYYIEQQTNETNKLYRVMRDKIYEHTFKAIIHFLSDFEPQKQKILIYESNLLRIIEQIFSYNSYDFQTQNFFEFNKIKVLETLCRLLVHLINDNKSKENSRQIYEKIIMTNKIELLKLIYYQKFVHNGQEFEYQKICNHSNSICNSMVCYNKYMTQLDYISYEISFNLFIFIKILAQQLEYSSIHHFFKETSKESKDINHLVEFFDKRIRSVEISKGQSIFTFHFARSEVNLENISELYYKLYSYKYIDYDEDRLRYFLNNSGTYKLQIRHRLQLKKYRTTYWCVYNWKIIKDVQLIIIVFVNLQMLQYDREKYLKGETNLFSFINILFQIQLAMCCFIVIFSSIERLPNAFHKEIEFGIEKQKKKLKSSHAQKQLTLLKIIIKNIKKFKDFIFDQLKSLVFLKVFLDPENIYNICIMIMTFIAYNNKFFYVLLLFDIIKRSKVIGRLVNTVLYNSTLIFNIQYVGIIQIYCLVQIYATNVDSFDKNYIPNTDLFGILTYFIDIIFRQNKEPSIFFIQSRLEDVSYILAWISSFWAFLIFRITILYCILAIIFDSFFMDRKLRYQYDKNQNQLCYICGLNQNKFAQIENGWVNHRRHEHNIVNYMDFLVYIDQNSFLQYNGIFEYIRNKLQNNQIDFFPIQRAISLQNIQNQ